MNKLIICLMSFILLFTISCDSDDTIVGGGIDIEPELVGVKEQHSMIGVILNFLHHLTLEPLLG